MNGTIHFVQVSCYCAIQFWGDNPPATEKFVLQQLVSRFGNVFKCDHLLVTPSTLKEYVALKARFSESLVPSFLDIYRYGSGPLRDYVESLLKPKGPDRSHYPHDCPRCGAPAYLGIVPAALDCSARCF